MMSYHEHREQRIAMAASYADWGHPPYPYRDGGRCIGRVVMTMLHMRSGNRILVLQPGAYRFNAEVESLFKAKEKWQNREKFLTSDK